MTRRQSQILAFIIQFRLDNGGCCPSYDEMCEAMGLHSKSAVARLLDGLKERGYISTLYGRARSVTVLRGLDGQPIGPGVAA